jgi:transcription initiation factor TFIIE subunit beta
MIGFSGIQRLICIRIGYVSLASSPQPPTDATQHEFSFRNKAALLTEIQRQTRKGGGIPVRALKESWKEAPLAIEELEKEGDVLVTRTVKDGQLRMVFWNEIKPDDESGGKQVEKGGYW